MVSMGGECAYRISLTEVERRLPLDTFADVVVDLQAVKAPGIGGLSAVYGSAAVAAEYTVQSSEIPSATASGAKRSEQACRRKQNTNTDVAAVMGACAGGAMDTGRSRSIDDILAAGSPRGRLQ